jgi:WhiA C-terminal HTH domain
MPSGRHKHKPLSYRPPAAERAWLLAYADKTGRAVNAVLTDAVRALRKTTDPAAADTTLPADALAGIGRYEPPARTQPRAAHLAQHNTRRAAQAGHRDAGSAAMILARLGAQCPPDYREVAEARIAAPDVPWSQIAAKLGMSKDAAIGKFRRLKQVARAQLEAADG